MRRMYRTIFEYHTTASSVIATFFRNLGIVSVLYAGSENIRLVARTKHVRRYFLYTGRSSGYDESRIRDVIIAFMKAKWYT